MSTRYVFIDYENVQPDTLAPLDPESDVVLLLTGPTPSRKLPKLREELRQFQQGSGCIRIDKPKHNAVDYVIAYLVGQLSVEQSKASFVVISKDNGYEALARYMKSKKRLLIPVERVDDKRLRKVQTASSSHVNELEGLLASVVKNLKGRPRARPVKRSTIRRAVDALLRPQGASDKTEQVVAQLFDRRIAIETGGKLSYNFKAYRPLPDCART